MNRAISKYRRIVLSILFLFAFASSTFGFSAANVDKNNYMAFAVDYENNNTDVDFSKPMKENDTLAKNSSDLIEPRFTLNNEEKDYITIYSPLDKLITIKDKILIKGLFLKNGKLLVNGQPIEIKAGRFYKRVDVPENGKNLLRFDFIDADNRITTIYRRILYLKAFDSISLEEYHNKFDNCDLKDVLSAKNEGKSPSPQYVTREKLAKIFVLIEKLEYNHVNNPQFIDIPDNYEYAKYIKTAVKNGVMDGYPDGTFRPQEYITKAQLIVIFSRFNKLDIPVKEGKLVFKDILAYHWAAKYISAAIENGLINSSDYFYPDNFVTNKMLVEMLARSLRVNEKANKLYNFNEGYRYAQAAASKNIDIEKTPLQLKKKAELKTPTPLQVEKRPVKSKVPDNKIEEKPISEKTPGITHPKIPSSSIKEIKITKVKSKIENLDKIADYYPNLILTAIKNKEITTKDKIYIRGRMNGYLNNTEIKINGELVRLTRSGRFNHKVTLPPGKSDIILTVNNMDFQYRIFRLNTYKDVPPNHWCYTTINKLNTLKYLYDSEYFYPNNYLTKKELAYTLNKIYGLLETTEPAKKIRDIDNKNPYQNSVKNVVDNNIMYLDAEGFFHPDDKIKKAEAIIYLSSLFTITGNTQEIPYKDVPLDHYAIDEITYFKNQGVISNDENFNPDNYITKAQFVALISKIPQINVDINKMENWK
ncbi:MAG: hypothetical protein A2X41_01665 [Candidatus Margulisbacteria bacterium GWE2_39_32]|nr:MAG: hypothetical protein A2X41_01665 [Candidatus Margulisbacteria bacterium GWE2_39_32]